MVNKSQLVCYFRTSSHNNQIIHNKASKHLPLSQKIIYNVCPWELQGFDCGWWPCRILLRFGSGPWGYQCRCVGSRQVPQVSLVFKACVNAIKMSLTSMLNLSEDTTSERACSPPCATSSSSLIVTRSSTPMASASRLVPCLILLVLWLIDWLILYLERWCLPPELVPPWDM